MCARSPTKSSTGTEPFLVIAENRLAFTAVSTLANPDCPAPVRLVVLCGGEGSGKSHLVAFAERLLRQEWPRFRVQVWEAEQFRISVSDAIAQHRLSDLQTAWSKVDLIVVQDIDLLASHGEAQVQLQRLLDNTLAAGSRVLLTSSKPPGQWRGMRAGLVNRIRSGVVALIRLPGRASRTKLLEHFCTIKGIAVGTDVLKDLAGRLSVMPGELLETLLLLDEQARNRKQAVTLPFARQYLLQTRQGRTFTIPVVAKAVARHFSLSVADLQSPARDQHLTKPRQCAMLLARELTGLGTAQIGQFFGRNHSTVIHACDKLRSDLPNNPALRLHLTEIRTQLGASEAET